MINNCNENIKGFLKTNEISIKKLMSILKTVYIQKDTKEEFMTKQVKYIQN